MIYDANIKQSRASQPFNVADHKSRNCSAYLETIHIRLWCATILVQGCSTTDSLHIKTCIFSVRHTIRLFANAVLQFSKFKVISFPRCLINERKFTIPMRNLLNDKVHLLFFQISKIGFVDLFSFLFDIYFPVLRLRMN
jgi:hypothetical protein